MVIKYFLTQNEHHLFSGALFLYNLFGTDIYSNIKANNTIN